MTGEIKICLRICTGEESELVDLFFGLTHHPVQIRKQILISPVINPSITKKPIAAKHTVKSGPKIKAVSSRNVTAPITSQANRIARLTIIMNRDASRIPPQAVP